VSAAGRWALAAAAVAAAVGAAAWWGVTSSRDYRLRAGREAVRAGRWGEAERMALRLEAAGDADHARLLRGEMFLRRGQVGPAVRAYNRIRRPDVLLDASALFGRGFLLDLKRPAEAERFLTFVAARRPDDVDTHRALATLYYDQGAWASAVAHLLAWGRLDPGDGRPFRLVGLIYKDLEQDKAAVPAYREALGRRLTDAVGREVRAELAECLTRLSHYDEALRVLDELGPAGSSALVALRAECVWGLGDAAKARALLNGALARERGSAALLRLRARIHAAEAEWSEASELLARAVAADPNDMRSRYQLAQAYEALGRTAEAAAERAKLATIQAKQKRLNELVSAAADRPWDAAPRRELAGLCRDLGRPDVAASWERAAAVCPR
jgi:tetratricopeptide (TPR) repeat protein